MIMRSDSPDSEDLNDPNFLELYQSAMDLYGIIHARYILSPHGLNKMREKFLQGAFGTCPRVLCERQHVLPIGVSEELSTSRVKVYCPRCVDVYLPRQKQLDIDGAYFGASFPHVFLKVSISPTLSFLLIFLRSLAFQWLSFANTTIHPQNLWIQNIWNERQPLWAKIWLCRSANKWKWNTGGTWAAANCLESSPISSSVKHTWSCF